jgi:hypothetical protein
MIVQGTDGLSKGDMMAGVMVGMPCCLLYPMGFSATERQHNLAEWVNSWWSDGKAKWLGPRDDMTAATNNDCLCSAPSRGRGRCAGTAVKMPAQSAGDCRESIDSALTCDIPMEKTGLQSWHLQLHCSYLHIDVGKTTTNPSSLLHVCPYLYTYHGRCDALNSW